MGPAINNGDAATIPPRRVYYVWDYVQWGGAQVYFLGLIREMRLHAEVCVILPKDSDEQLLSFIENTGVSIKFVDTQADAAPAHTFLRKIQRHRNKLRSEFKLVRFVLQQDLRDAIVHVELAPWQSLFSLMRLAMRSKVFITTHNSLPPAPVWRVWLWKAKFYVISRFSNFHIFASNRDAKESFQPLMPRRLFEDIRVTYTNVNPLEIDEALDAEIDRAALLEKYGIPSDRCLVFCVGQFIDRKGRWTFLEAARQASENAGGLAFVWISNSQASSDDIERAAEFGLGDDFIFLTGDQIGPKHIDLIKFLKLADIFALVSFQEGLPIALLEAMALGIASISTRVNAIPEALKHLDTGWLIEPGDVAELTRAFIELRDDTSLREKLGRNGREHVLREFDERAVAQIALNGYREAF